MNTHLQKSQNRDCGKMRKHHLLHLFAILLGIQPDQCSSTAAGQETLLGIRGQDFVVIGADSSISSNIALTASNFDKIMVLVDPFPAAGGGGDRTIPKDQIYNHNRQQTILAAAAGDPADADRLLSLLRAHCAIREFENGVGCDVEFLTLQHKRHGNNNDDDDQKFVTHKMVSHYPGKYNMGLDAEMVAHVAKGEISSALRSRAQMKVCLLIAGLCRISKNKNQHESSNAMIQRQHHEGQEQKLLEPRLLWIDEYGSLQSIRYGAHGFGANFALSILDRGYRSDMTREEAVELVRDCFRQLRVRYVINSPQPPCIKCVDADGCSLVMS